MKTKGIHLTKIPDIPDCELTPTVVQLLELLQERDSIISFLLDDIARSKKHKTRPDIKPSSLEKDQPPSQDSNPDDKKKKKKRKKKKKKTKDLPIHETITIQPEHIPDGSTFKDYRSYTVQSIEIKVHNIRYVIARWETPDGRIIRGKLPSEVAGHFGDSLVRYILYQYYHNHVTQPLILEELIEYGIDISAAEISRILTQNKDRFHQEKNDILAAALTVSDYINVDDTGARHKGQNGYTTHIGNEWFAWFESTGSKSRINFLELLRAAHKDYVLDDLALTYMIQAGLPSKPLTALTTASPQYFENKDDWEAFLNQHQITTARHRKIATEGALMGSIIHHGIASNLAVISDDAGQFNILIHGLCWLHAERTINRIVPFGDRQKKFIEDIRDEMWRLYQDLKAYKKEPDTNQIEKLEACFDDLFTTKTEYKTLDLALERLHKNKKELLLVLERPEIPLHNNASENDIRDVVKKRKISSGTRSDDGRKSRDTFASLKKTCRKNSISFWDYLSDRLKGANKIPPLSQIVLQKLNAP